MNFEDDIIDDRDKLQIIELWAKDKPQEAKMWQAYYMHSPHVYNVPFEKFITNLKYESQYKSRYAHNSPYEIYQNWKEWLENHEAYKEFKEKAHQEWEQIKVDKHCEYIVEAAHNLLYPESPFWEDGILTKDATIKAQKILDKWILGHPKLWKEITLRYKSGRKSDEDYLYQAWIETFDWSDTFTVWKLKNSSLWKQFKIECDKRAIIEKMILKAVWLEKHEYELNNWILAHSEMWNHFYEKHRMFLWYSYAEVLWTNFLEERKTKEEEKKARAAEKEEERKTRENEKEKERAGEEEKRKAEEEVKKAMVNNTLTDTEENEEEIFFSQEDIEEIFRGIDEEEEEDNERYYLSYHTLFKWEDLERGDPRYKYFCRSNEEEDNIHDIIIAQYEKDLSENSEKSVFIQQHCSEDGFNVFLNRTKTDYDYEGRRETTVNVEESPKKFADRKMFDLWINKHKGQWNRWMYHYYWTKEYGNTHYETKECYEVWKQLNANKWQKWQNDNFESWKQKAQNVDLWFEWLSDGNEFFFQDWASSNYKKWEGLMSKIIRHYCSLAFNHLFKYSEISFDDWNHSNSEEQEYWDPFIREQIIMEEFQYNWRNLPYIPQYKLHIQFMEKLYLLKLGKDIFYNHLALIEDYSRYGFINENGLLVIPPKFEEAHNFCNGFAAVKIRNKWGLINTKGEFSFEPQYDHLILLENGLYAVAKKEGTDYKWALLSNTGIELTPFIYSYFYKIDDNEYVITNVDRRQSLDKIGIIENIAGKFVSNPQYARIKLLDNGLYAMGKKEGTDYKWALLSNTGIELTPFIYSNIYDTTDDVLANVGSKQILDENGHIDCIDGKWGYLDMEGNEIEPFIFANNAEDFYSLWLSMHYNDFCLT